MTQSIAKYRNPLEPINTIVTMLVALAAFVTVLSLVFTFAGSGSFLGFGKVWPTIDVPQVEEASLRGWHVRPGTWVSSTAYRLSVEHPSVGQRFWSTLYGLPITVLIVGGLLLALRLIRRAALDGLYTVATASRLRTLGWFLIVGQLVRTVVMEISANRLLATMVTDRVGWVSQKFWDMSLTMLIFGATLLTIARVMRIGAQMNSDLEGTV